MLIDLGVPKADARTRAAPFGGNWLYGFISLDPRDYLKDIRAPIFAFWGEKDLQVDAQKNRAAFPNLTDPHPKNRLTVFEGLNHLMQPATTGAISEYGEIETTISPEVLDAMREWLGELDH